MLHSMDSKRYVFLESKKNLQIPSNEERFCHVRTAYIYLNYDVMLPNVVMTLETKNGYKFPKKVPHFIRYGRMPHIIAVKL